MEWCCLIGERVLQAVEVLKGMLGEEVAATVGNLVREHLLPKPPTPAPASPTEAERWVRLAELSKKKMAAEKKVEDRKGRLEKAGERVVEEEGNLVTAEKELADVEGGIHGS